MSRPLVTSHDLTSFFDSTRRDAQGMLPLLVRRLIFATTSQGSLGPLSMPSGDDIRLRGWDGRSELAGSHPYVPTGRVVWELGTTADIKQKADSDYRKRSTDPGSVEPAETTFVFVTPHVWEGKENWAAARRAERRWKDVRVLDAQLLSEWLDAAPGLTVWFNRERGWPVDDAEDLQTAWSRIVEDSAGRSVAAALVIGGREAAASKLRDWLLRPSGDLDLVADSAEEAVAFVAAVAQGAMSESDPVDLSACIFVARGRGASQCFGAHLAQQVLVLENPTLVSELRSRRSRSLSFIVPTEIHSASRPGDTRIELGQVRREPVREALARMGVSDQEADRIARASRGSLDAVLWGLGPGALRGLPWLQQPEASRLAPLVLARRWGVDHEADHAAIARLCDRDYRDVRETAATWGGPRGPIKNWGSYWDWKAWRTAWEHLAPSFTADLTRRFRETALMVLGTPDPALELPASERWLASLQGKVHPYSAPLREGLVRSIAMFGAIGDRVPHIGGQALASGLVTSILHTENAAANWKSLAHWLPDLAEAAPEAFLAAVEEFIREDKAASELFVESGPLGPGSLIVHVLWAVERLAWNSDLLPRVAVLLGRLDRQDPGGNSSNRPSNSLRTLFLPWRPGTTATFPERTAAFEELLRQCPDSGWRCAMVLLPRDHDMVMALAKPEFRPWPVERGPTTVQEYFDFVNWLTDRMVALAGQSASRWCEFADCLPNLMRSAPPCAERVVAALRALDRHGWSDQEQFELGDKLRTLVQHHAEFPGAHWSLKGPALETLRTLAEGFAPSRARDKFRWLFARLVRLPGWTGREWEADQEQLDAARAEAIQAVRAEAGLEGLAAWGHTVEDPFSLSFMIAKSDLTDDQERWILDKTLFLPEARDETSVQSRMGSAFVSARELKRGTAWGIERLREARERLGDEIACRFAVALNATPELWRHLETTSDMMQRYWKTVRSYFLDIAEIEIAVPKLLGAGRSLAAISITGHLVFASKPTDDPERRARVLALCTRVMADVPVEGPEFDRHKDNIGNLGYTIAAVLNYIEEHGGNDEAVHALVANWEWAWLPVLEHSQRGLRSLCRELSRSPEFFVDVLKLVYHGRNEPSDQPGTLSERERALKRVRAQQGYTLLRTWRMVPGLEWPIEPGAIEDPEQGLGVHHARPAVKGRVDPGRLEEWIITARRMATDADRIAVCDQHIGQVFAFAPSDADGSWPCKPVRDCIERLASAKLEDGFELAMANRRGVFEVGETGKDERRLRDEYLQLADRIKEGSPRTAGALQRMGKRYEADARRREDQGRLREFGED